MVVNTHFHIFILCFNCIEAGKSKKKTKKILIGNSILKKLTQMMFERKQKINFDFIYRPLNYTIFINKMFFFLNIFLCKLNRYKNSFRQSVK